MQIEYTRKAVLSRGLGHATGPHCTHLGYFLFREGACYFGVLPPYTLLNKMLAQGKLVSSRNMLLEWQPFRLRRLQYENLKEAITEHPEWGGEVDEGFRGSRKYWDRWAMLRSVNRLPSLSDLQSATMLPIQP